MMMMMCAFFEVGTPPQKRTTVESELPIFMVLPSHVRKSSMFAIEFALSHNLLFIFVCTILSFLLALQKSLAAHHAAIYFATKGLSPRHRPSVTEQHANVTCNIIFDKHGDTAADSTKPKVRPLRVPNPVGLAAGFDKDAVIIQPMLDLGFGFVEVGTVTPKPQEGNPKPRMFRLPEHFGIINRYGFNSPGADVVQTNLQAYYQQYSSNRSTNAANAAEPVSIPRALWNMVAPALLLVPPATGAIGINIGKNRDSVERDQVLADYTSLIRQLGPWADYLVLNVSSPNTAGLRDWQSGDALKSLLQACLEERDKLAHTASSSSSNDDGTVPPLFVKLAPDLTDEQLQDIAATCLAVGIDGIVVTNTTNQRPADLIHHHLAQEAGGLSGQPVKQLSTSCIRKLYSATRGQIPIVGVGGIASGQDAYEKICAGASLVQVYSMLVYEGPGVVSRIRHELAEIMALEGHKSIQDMVGCDHEDMFWEKRQKQLELLDQQAKQLLVQQQEETFQEETNDNEDDEAMDEAMGSSSSSNAGSTYNVEE